MIPAADPEMRTAVGTICQQEVALRGQQSQPQAGLNRPLASTGQILVEYVGHFKTSILTFMFVCYNWRLIPPPSYQDVMDKNKTPHWSKLRSNIVSLVNLNIPKFEGSPHHHYIAIHSLNDVAGKCMQKLWGCVASPPSAASQDYCKWRPVYNSQLRPATPRVLQQLDLAPAE